VSLHDNTNNGFKLKNGEGIATNFHGTKITVKVSGIDSDNRYTLTEMVHPPNTGPALHTHSKALKATIYLKVNTV
jgi:hypothetical protein